MLTLLSRFSNTDSHMPMLAGDMVTYTFEATNIGTIRLRNVTVDLPTVSPLNCTRNIDGAAFTAGDVLELGDQFTCIGIFNFSQDNLEQPDKVIHVKAQAKASTGWFNFTSNDYTVKPINSPSLAIYILTADCTPPTKARKCGCNR